MSRVAAPTPGVAHTTIPLAVGAIAGGVLATSSGTPAALGVCAVTAGVLLALAALFAELRIACLALSVGLLATTVTMPARSGPLPADHIAGRAPAAVVAVEGVVAVRERSTTALRLTVRGQRYRDAGEQGPVQGLLALTIAHPRREWPVGASIRAVGRLRAPRGFGNPGGYDFRRALARRGVFVTMFLWDDAAIDELAPAPPGLASSIATLRAHVEARIAALSDEPSRGFLGAVLIGNQSSLAPELQQVLGRTGLTHVVSVSGFHLTVVAAAAILGVGWLLGRSERLLLSWNTQKIATVAGIVPVLAYGEIAGGSVPATRALLMYAAVLAAMLVDRPVDGLRALAAAGVAFTLAVPDIGADIGFELSFVSVAALILVMRWRAARALVAPAPARGSALVRHVWTALIVSLAAGIATAPLTAWHFQQVSLIAPLANLIALPFLGPATMLPGLAALPLLTVAPALADVLLRIAAGAAAVGLRIATVLAALPYAAVSTPMPNLGELALCYVALGLPLIARTSARSRWLGQPRRLVACAVAAAVLADIGYWAWERLENPRLRVTFLSVGQGDATVVELPHGGVMVIDGGGLASTFDTGERLVAPFLRSRKILRVETLVLSHPQLDHYGGLAYLAEHFAPREFWSNGVATEAVGFARLERALDRAGTRRVVLRHGVPPIVRRGVVIEVLHPEAQPSDDLNNGSLVLRFVHGAASFLFTGDIEREAEESLVAGLGAAPERATVGHDDGNTGDTCMMAPASLVLKVPHHGSATSSSAALLHAVRPRVAVISAGADNRFGFPAPAVVARLQSSGAALWRTDLDGAVHVESDGARVTVATPCGARRVRAIDLKSLHCPDTS